jgi:hypothetical protein
MLTPPDDLPEATLAPMLERWWGMAAASVQYQALGWAATTGRSPTPPGGPGSHR